MTASTSCHNTSCHIQNLGVLAKYKINANVTIFDVANETYSYGYVCGFRLNAFGELVLEIKYCKPGSNYDHDMVTGYFHPCNKMNVIDPV